MGHAAMRMALSAPSGRLRQPGANRMKIISGLEELKTYVGKEIGVSNWCEVTQEMINTFADATGDHQWIHVDVERAKKESPYGGPIAHGFLTLSLTPKLVWEVYKVDGVKMGVNYGVNKVRFPAPVPAGQPHSSPREIARIAGDRGRRTGHNPGHL